MRGIVNKLGEVGNVYESETSINTLVEDHLSRQTSNKYIVSFCLDMVEVCLPPSWFKCSSSAYHQLLHNALHGHVFTVTTGWCSHASWCSRRIIYYICANSLEESATSPAMITWAYFEYSFLVVYYNY